MMVRFINTSILLNYAYGGCIIMKDSEVRKIKRQTHTSYVPLRFHKLVEVWFDKSEPLFDTAFNVTTTFLDISNDSP